VKARRPHDASLPPRLGRLQWGVILGLLIVIVLAGLWLVSGPPTPEEERDDLVDQLGLQPDGLSLQDERQQWFSTARTWDYRPYALDAGGATIYTLNGRMAYLQPRGRLPMLVAKGLSGSPVALSGGMSIDVVASHGPDLPEHDLRDLAVLAVAAVFDLSVMDAEGQTLCPKLQWSPRLNHATSAKAIDVTVQRRTGNIPAELRIALFPETKQMGRVMVVEW